MFDETNRGKFVKNLIFTSAFTSLIVWKDRTGIQLASSTAGFAAGMIYKFATK